MLENYICPYCEVMFVPNEETSRLRLTSFTRVDLTGIIGNFDNLKDENKESIIQLSYYHCPSCQRYSVEIFGIGDKVSEIDYRVLPFGKAKEFPEYIPKAIREDYEEACLIKDLSPKAAATLARRCLQGMIRDFWKIKEKNLHLEISKLKEKIPASQWKVIDAVRQMGNIGAHMEQEIDKIVQIDPREAENLIRLIEFLIEKWYIDTYETDLLFSDITDVNKDKQKQRKK